MNGALLTLTLETSKSTHLSLDKMAAILQTTFSKKISLMKRFIFWIEILWKFVSKGPIDNKAVLVQVMAWCQTGTKPLPEPILIQFNDAHIRH